MRSCCAALVFLLVLLASACTPHLNLNPPFHARQPNPHEEFYTAVAANFGDSKMCEKISKRALDEDAPTLSSTEWKAILQKSECYFYVAMSTKSTKLCDSVSQIVTLPSNRSDMSEAHCRELLRKNQHYIDEPSPDYSWLADFMKEMGYREEDVYAAMPALIGDKEDIWPAFYIYLQFRAQPNQKQEFIKRAEALPSFTN
jgi:hypothetical protein